MDNELQKIIQKFDELFKHHKNITKDKTTITLSDLDAPLDKIVKDEQLRELLCLLDKWIIDNRR